MSNLPPKPSRGGLGWFDVLRLDQWLFPFLGEIFGWRERRPAPPETEKRKLSEDEERWQRAEAAHLALKRALSDPDLEPEPKQPQSPPYSAGSDILGGIGMAVLWLFWLCVAIAALYAFVWLIHAFWRAT